MKRLLFSFFLLLLLGTVTSACQKGKGTQAESEPTFNNTVEKAALLRMSDYPDYSIVEIINPSDTTESLARYVLVDKNKELPETLPKGVLLRTPFERLTLFSTIYTDVLDELGRADAVAGVVDSQYITTPSVLRGLEKGTVVDCGSSSSPTIESLLSSGSEAVVYCFYDGMDIKGLDRADIPAIPFVDNYETDPLGRAEWILLLGKLVGKESEARAVYKGVSTRYNEIRKESEGIAKRPEIMTDNLYNGVWYVPGGKSYQARMISDAGGDYILASDKSAGSLSLSLEEMMSKAAGADIWLMRSVFPLTDRSDLLKQDKRYSFFTPFKTGKVYVADGSVTNVFTISAFHPDVMLREYAEIFREGSEEGGQSGLKYYKKLK